MPSCIGQHQAKGIRVGREHGPKPGDYPAVLADAAHRVAGSNVPVEIVTVPLGEPGGLPWTERLLPLVVLMAVFFGGLMIPASSLINEKQKRTLEALNVTPATLGDVFAAKGVMGRYSPSSWSFIAGRERCIVGPVLGTAAGTCPRCHHGGGDWTRKRGGGEGHEHTVHALETWRPTPFWPGHRLHVPQYPCVDRLSFPNLLRHQADGRYVGVRRSFAGELLYLVVLVGLVVLGFLLVANVVRRLSRQALRLNG